MTETPGPSFTNNCECGGALHQPGDKVCRDGDCYECKLNADGTRADWHGPVDGDCGGEKADCDTC